VIKSELIEKITEANPHLYQTDVERIVNAILDEITDALSRGARVELRGFGAFSVKYRSARVGRNPRAGTKVSVTEKYAPFFKTGKDVRDRLNHGSTVTPRASSHAPKSTGTVTGNTAVADPDAMAMNIGVEPDPEF